MSEVSLNLVPLRALSVSAIRNGAGEKGLDYDPAQIRYVRTTDIAGPRTLKHTAKRSISRVVGEKYRLEVGDLLMTAAGATIGKSYLHETEIEDCCFAGFLVRVQPQSRLLGRYLSHWSQSSHFYDQIWSGAVISTIPNFSAGRYRSLQVPLPATDVDMTLIVRYLDHAELRIAKAIDGKNNLVKLLEEKRKVAVEDIVLGRHAGHTMSETGLPWAGQMPAHWDLVPLRSLLRPRKRVVGNRHSEYSLLSLTLGGVILRDLSEMKGKFPASFDTYQEVRDGDFVMCLFDVEETPRTIGLSAMQGMITGAYDVFESLDPSASDYLYEFLLTVDREKRLQPLYRGLRKTVPRSSLLSIQVPLPPTNEREEIVKRVRTETSQLDSAVQSLRSEIALLKEYRTRLISDVVTGKIDVREEAAKLPDIDPAELAAVLAGGAAGADEEEEVADGDD